MAPVAVTEQPQTTQAQVQKPAEAQKVFNPFYSPPSDEDTNENYEYVQYKVSSRSSSLTSVFY